MKKYLKQLKENKKGFTLIEMIVVIAIIGILAAILVPSMSGYLGTAKDAKKEANARTVYTAAQAAVTSLETTNPVKNGTYTKDKTSVSGSGTGATEAVAKDLFDKISKLIGASNYAKFDEIKVTVKDGAVTEVKVNDGSGEATYPTPTPTTTPTT